MWNAILQFVDMDPNLSLFYVKHEKETKYIHRHQSIDGVLVGEEWSYPSQNTAL